MQIFRESGLYFQKDCRANDLRVAGRKALIGVHGIRGSFTEEALLRLMREYLMIEESEFELKELVHSKRVIEEAATGDVDFGIFAYANSSSGGYVSSLEGMGDYLFDVVASFAMPINMCMIVDPSVNSVDDLVEFTGHPTAVRMCRKNLAEKYPKVLMNPATDEMDTSLSVELLKKGDLPRDRAVFASRRAAEIFEMKVLVEGIQDDPNNATFFTVIKSKSI